jgi:hypothetical protein
MSTVAVVARARKSFGGGLRELREVLAREGVGDPLWCEVKKGRHAARCARGAAAEGVGLIFVWGGDRNSAAWTRWWPVWHCGSDPAGRHGQPPGCEPART